VLLTELYLFELSVSFWLGWVWGQHVWGQGHCSSRSRPWVFKAKAKATDPRSQGQMFSRSRPRPHFFVLELSLRSPVSPWGPHSWFPMLI